MIAIQFLLKQKATFRSAVI